MNPTFSIIIPTYNVEKYLSRCIDSILSQTYRDFEVLLINDGSTDGSGKICDEYASKDTRITVFHKENGGVSSARNLGLEKANGEYIVFVDSDDYLPKDGLQNMIETIRNKSGFNLYCFVGTTKKDTQNVSKEQLPQDFSVEELSKDDFIRKILLYKTQVGPWAKVYRRSHVQQLRFDESMKIGEDLFFLLQFSNLQSQNIIMSKIPVYYYCLNLASAMHQKDLREPYFLLTRKVNDFFEKEDLEYIEFLSFKTINFTQPYTANKIIPPTSIIQEIAKCINPTIVSYNKDLYKFARIANYSIFLAKAYLKWIYIRGYIKSALRRKS